MKMRKRNCLKLSIGLFCGQIQNYNSIRAIASTFDYGNTQDVEFLGWRCGAYPGNARFRTKNGQILDKPLYDWLDIAVTHFNLKRCNLCPDGGNWLADMTLGDIHAGGKDETVIVCRTKRAKEILDEAKKKEKIQGV